MHSRSLGRARDRIAAVGPHGPEVGVAVGEGVGVGMVPLSAPGVAQAGATAPTASSSRNTMRRTYGARWGSGEPVSTGSSDAPAGWRRNGHE